MLLRLSDENKVIRHRKMRSTFESVRINSISQRIWVQIICLPCACLTLIILCWQPKWLTYTANS